MRILIDECLDWWLCRSLPGHVCTSVQKMGWSGVQNGELLGKANAEFDVFITGDRNLAFQQITSTYNLTIVVLHADNIQLPATRALMSQVGEVLKTSKLGAIVDIYP
jgi:predicted nuclease of predicted toxin-antitoxin system